MIHHSLPSHVVCNTVIINLNNLTKCMENFTFIFLYIYMLDLFIKIDYHLLNVLYI